MAPPPPRVPISAAALVLRACGVDDDGDHSLAALVAAFLFSAPSWRRLSLARFGDDEPAALRFLHWLHARHPAPCFRDDDSGPLDFTIMDVAARAGFLSAVQLLHETRCEGCSPNALHFAARRGHVELVKYLYEVVQAPHSHLLWENAAQSGDLALVQYLRSVHDGLSPSRRAFESVEWTSRVIDNAAAAGHVCIVQWLHETHGERCSGRAFEQAAIHGYLPVVQYIHEHQRLTDADHAIDGAAIHGRLDVLTFLLNHGYDGYASTTMDLASENGHLAIVQFLHAHRHEGCSTDAMDGAAINGHIDVVRYLHENRSEGCTERAMHGAAANGHLAVVQFLHERRNEGCTNATALSCIAARQYETFRFMEERGLVSLHHDHFIRSVTRPHQELMTYLYERCVPCDGPERSSILTAAATSIAKQGTLDQLKFLDTKLLPDDVYDESVINTAVSMSRTAVVEYLLVKPYALCAHDAMATAVKQRNLALTKLLYENRPESCVQRALVQSQVGTLSAQRPSAMPRRFAEQRRLVREYVESLPPCACSDCAPAVSAPLG